MKGYKYTIKIDNYDTNESYVDFSIHSMEDNDHYRTIFEDRLNQVNKEIEESEMPYDYTIYGRSDANGAFYNHTYTIYKRD